MESKECEIDSNQIEDIQEGEDDLSLTCGSVKEKTALSLLREANQKKSFVKNFVCDGGVVLLKEVRKGNVDKVVDLLCRGVPFISDSTGVSPLHYAVYNNSVEITELLLNGGILRDLKNKVDRSPLHIAAQMNHVGVLKTLLTFGADQDITDMMKMTPLHWAVENGNISCVKILLLYGAKHDVADIFGRTPLDLSKNSKISNLLKDHANKLTANKWTEPTDINCDNGIEEIQEETDIGADQGKYNTDANQQNLFPKADCQSSVSNMDSSSLSFMDTDKDPMELLKEHGIQMLEPDKITTIHSAMESGQKIVLTEAGKLALDTASKKEQGAKRVYPSDNSSADSVIVLQNGQKFIKIHKNDLKKFHLDRDRCFFSIEGEPKTSIRFFKGKQYTEEEDEELKKQLQSAISKLRSEAYLLDTFSKRKFRQANGYQQQLLMLIRSKKGQPNSDYFDQESIDSN